MSGEIKLEKPSGSKSNLDVLIIDDDPAVIEVLQMYCENMGCFRNVITASDGSIASKKLHNQKFHLILMDINMPRKTGIDLLKEFDERNPNQITSVVIVSGELAKDKIALSMKRGVKHFITKPFDEPTFQQKALAILKTIAATNKKK